MRILFTFSSFVIEMIHSEMSWVITTNIVSHAFCNFTINVSNLFWFSVHRIIASYFVLCSKDFRKDEIIAGVLHFKNEIRFDLRNLHTVSPEILFSEGLPIKWWMANSDTNLGLAKYREKDSMEKEKILWDKFSFLPTKDYMRALRLSFGKY